MDGTQGSRPLGRELGQGPGRSLGFCWAGAGFLDAKCKSRLEQRTRVRRGREAVDERMCLLRVLPNCLFFFLRFYLFIHETEREREREAETQAEGEAGSMQGARPGTRFRASRITLKVARNS